MKKVVPNDRSGVVIRQPLITSSRNGGGTVYRLFWRTTGTEVWQEGATFSGEMLTPEAREMLVERHARSGLEAKLEKVSEDEGEEG